MNAGPEGGNWKPAGPNDKGLDGQPARWTDTKTVTGDAAMTTQNNNWGQQAPYVLTPEFRAAWTTTQDLLTVGGYELRLYRETKVKYEPYAPKEWFTPVFLQASQTEEIAQLRTNISDFVTQSTVQFIVGEKKIDSDWDAYISQLNSLGLARYVDIYQTAYSAKFPN